MNLGKRKDDANKFNIRYYGENLTIIAESFNKV